MSPPQVHPPGMETAGHLTALVADSEQQTHTHQEPCTLAPCVSVKTHKMEIKKKQESTDEKAT